MDNQIDLIIPFFIDVIAGLIGAAIFAGLALLLRMTGSKRTKQWGFKLRRMGWFIMALVFFATALTSAIIRGQPGPSAIAFGTFLLLVIASVLLLRFRPALIRGRLYKVRIHVWPILTGLFLLTTILLLLIDPRVAAHGERIVFVVDLADEEMIVMRDILDDLEPELGAEVFLMSVDSSRYIVRLDKMVSSDDMRWDLLAADNNMVGVLAAKGLVEELTDFKEREILMPNTLLPSLRPLLVFEDKIYFAPFRPNVKIAFWNKKKFDQYGLAPPRTWHELLEVARVFKDNEGVGRVAIQGYPGKTTAVTTVEFVKAGGGDPLRLADEQSRKTFEFLQELEPYLAPEYTETRFDTANELLIDEQVYLVMNWTYTIKVVVEDAGKTEIKAYSGWRGPMGEFHVLGGDVLAIPKGAPHPDKAAKLMELLLSKEVQRTLFDRLRWLPVRADAYEDVSPELSPYYQAVLKAVSHSVTRPKDPQWCMAESVLDEAFGGLVRKRQPIDSLVSYSASLEMIPMEFMQYCVQPGDTIETIAYRFNTTVGVLAEANGMTPKTSIGPGQILLVPGAESIIKN